MFQPFQTLQVQLHTPQTTFLNFFTSFILKISRFTPFLSTLFHSSSSKSTTTTAQFPFYNCKLHFTTAQIVISCTLKYALGKYMLLIENSLNFFKETESSELLWRVWFLPTKSAGSNADRSSSPAGKDRT